jgi:hypothetical protein
MKIFLHRTTLIFFLIACSLVNAQEDCRNYRKQGQSKLEFSSEGPKIVVTVEEAVDFDDSRVVQTAREIAELEGAKQIAQFLQRDLKSSSKLEQAVMTTVSVSGEGKKATYDQARKLLTSLSQNSDAVLRGVVLLDECYTPGKFLRLSMGIKPETIKAAGILADGISSSLKKNPTPKAANSTGSKKNESQSASKEDKRKNMELNNVPGYGGSDAVDKF